ncbi:motility associated factor glycosyltransferase family protein [Pelagicoccus sp. NFK12]|uniref:Motility associated factor glycosyltransferase family protein n=1 Tax=Pelagicoccus enzymogenes TaxID=2773457 RepID=A0A927FDB2_9BACT|nr:6-hydroxymethylpterin diphosphokinase MptE-like protein [Pelagicoccus enzymogenes]MBD5781686.1 motility associated factor glycosyltransferase family protein [Pelagicoccus enzymogenes]
MSQALSAFCERFPLLASRVKAVPASEEPVAAWKESTADVAAVLARWLSGKRFPHDSAIAVSGVGDGSHLEALLELLPAEALVFCAEADPERFKSFLGMPSAEALLKDPRMVFGVGALDDSFFNALATERVVDFTNAEPLIFAPLFNLNESYYEQFFLQFVRQLEMWRKLFGTNLTKSGLWQGNSFRNFHSLMRAPDPIEFGDAFKGLPMIMAGAGPSLDESLDFLRWAQDRAVIVAGNSSIRALVNAGVRPHFVLAADPYPTTDSGFEGVDLGETVLLCSFMVYPAVVQRFGDRIAAWAYNNKVATYFRRVAGRDRIAHVTEQGTISACAFDIAMILGCSSLFFVGQDLAARLDGAMHAADSFYTDKGAADRIALEKCRWMPGNTIEKVPVEEKLFVYLKTFEQLSRIYGKELQIKNRETLRIYNLSRLGARIEHMPYRDFEAAKTLIEPLGVGGVAAGWKATQAKLAESRAGWGRVGKALREFRAYVEEICSHSLKHALALEQGDLPLEVAEAEKAKVDAFIASKPDFEEILRDGQLKMELYVHARAIAKQSRVVDMQSEKSRAEKVKEYFWAVAEGSYQVLAAIDAARQAQKV